jgi:hypothetical protein
MFPAQRTLVKGEHPNRGLGVESGVTDRRRENADTPRGRIGVEGFTRSVGLATCRAAGLGEGESEAGPLFWEKFAD